jgi:hypothetical protein
MNRLAFSFAFFVGTILLAGCGGGENLVVVKGKLTKAGQPLSAAGMKLPPGDLGIQLIFIPEGGGQDEPGVVNSDGSFAVSGAKGNGIKPGKYKVAITLGAFGTKDELGGIFSREKTKCVREVSATAKEFTIDVSKPEG